MVDYIDQHRDVFGVEPICRVLTEHGCTIAPSTYYAAKVRPPSSRAERHATLMPILLTLWVANYRVYGARKLWKAARRAGHAVGRDQVARLMAELGIGGVRRGRRVFTTRADPAAARPADLVQRRFAADRPNQLWVSDLTYVATWSGVAYVCFIVDAFSRMIVGWRVAAHMRTEMVLDAVEMASRSRGTWLDGLVAHSDAGSQGGIKWSSQHLDHGGVVDDDAGAAEGGAAVSGADSLAGSADSGVAAGPGAVLGGDRARCQFGGRGAGDRCVIRGWRTVVPSRWRREPQPRPDGVGPLPGFR
jgi:putative transposase